MCTVYWVCLFCALKCCIRLNFAPQCLLEVASVVVSTAFVMYIVRDNSVIIWLSPGLHLSHDNQLRIIGYGILDGMFTITYDWN